MASRDLVFVDVDTQFDFMDPRGSLYVPGAVEIQPNLQRLIDFARQQHIPVVATVDAHAADDPEFSTFPPHCVRNTPGQRKIAATTLPTAEIVPSNAVDHDFSKANNLILEKTVFDTFGNENAPNVFRAMDAQKYVVFGVATDYCVRLAVMGLLARGHKVALVTDAISGVNAEQSQTAVSEMQHQGAELVQTQDVLNWREQQQGAESFAGTR